MTIKGHALTVSHSSHTEFNSHLQSIGQSSVFSPSSHTPFPQVPHQSHNFGVFHFLRISHPRNNRSLFSGCIFALACHIACPHRKQYVVPHHPVYRHSFHHSNKIILVPYPRIHYCSLVNN